MKRRRSAGDPAGWLVRRGSPVSGFVPGWPTPGAAKANHRRARCNTGLHPWWSPGGVTRTPLCVGPPTTRVCASPEAGRPDCGTAAIASPARRHRPGCDGFRRSPHAGGCVAINRRQLLRTAGFRTTPPAELDAAHGDAGQAARPGDDRHNEPATSKARQLSCRD